MQKRLPILFLSLLSILVVSCSKDQPDGLWDDNIHLSTKDVAFHAAEDSVIVTTEGEWWWVTEVSIGDSTYYNFEDINLEADSYTIGVEDVTVERRNTTTLFIRAGANPSAESRRIRVGLEAGNYFDGVTVTQAGASS